MAILPASERKCQPAGLRCRSEAGTSYIPSRPVTHVAEVNAPAPWAAWVTRDHRLASPRPDTAERHGRTNRLGPVGRHQRDHAAAESAAGHPGAERARAAPRCRRSDRCASVVMSKSSRIDACDAVKMRPASAKSESPQRRNEIEHPLVLGQHMAGTTGIDGVGDRGRARRPRGPGSPAATPRPCPRPPAHTTADARRIRRRHDRAARGSRSAAAPHRRRPGRTAPASTVSSRKSISSAVDASPNSDDS